MFIELTSFSDIKFLVNVNKIRTILPYKPSGSFDLGCKIEILLDGEENIRIFKESYDEVKQLLNTFGG